MIIYQIKNKTTGKIYIGKYSKCNSEKEFQKSNYWGSGVYIKRAIEKEGKENFEKKVLLKDILSKNELNYYESLIIKEKNTKTPNGYNLTDGGDGLTNPSEEVREKISKGNSGKIRTEEMIQRKKEKIKNNPNAGMKGKHHTEVTKQKLSEYFKENPSNYWLGKTLSKETTDKMSKVRKGRISWNKGIPTSDETKKKISITKKGRPWTQARRNAQNKGKQNECSGSLSYL